MSFQKRQKEWLAHVWLEGGTCVETNVHAADRWEASALVYKKLGLTDANDPRIRRFVMDEVPPDPPPPAAAGTSVVALTPRKPFYRYRVRLYAGPSSGNLIARTISTTSAQDALWDVMKMHKIPTEAVLGPYVVEQETADGKITKLIKDAHTFPDAGPLDAPVSTSKPKPLTHQPVDEHFPAEEPAVYDDDGTIWGSYRSAAERNWRGGWEVHLRRPSQEDVLKKIEDIFKYETKVSRRKRTIVKG